MNNRQRVFVEQPAVSLEVVFTATLAISAILLFWIQPMFAKMVLPLLGGAPAVWNTAMVFFQASLLAGYAYAHFSTQWFDVRKQSLAHIVVLLFAFISLPIAVSSGWAPPTDSTPVVWLIGLLAASIGLPFFALSATAPLLQKWFSHTTHKDAKNPYFLYAVSNAGSILALLAYPVLIEPTFGLERQSTIWTGTYIALVVLMVTCVFLLYRNFEAVSGEEADVDTTSLVDKVSGPLRLRWIILAFVPSSLLLGVTTHISTDLAAVPLLWVIPLALYLLTFVLVFARKQPVPHLWMVKIQAYLLLLFVIVLHFGVFSLSLSIFLHLATFFVTAMVCHGELAKFRPHSRHLTEFYLWMSFGGVLGGVFNALLAPMVFTTVAEYPIAIVLACALRPMLEEGRKGRWQLDIILPLLLAAAVWFVFQVPSDKMVWLFDENWKLVLVGSVVAMLVFSFTTRPVRLALGIGVLLFAASNMMNVRSTVHAERSFFGVHQIKKNDDASIYLLRHGSTNHGAQSIDPDKWQEPLAYYTREGPVGQVFDALHAATEKISVGMIGLGAGATSCYRRPIDEWTFFEIDPAVLKIARNEEYFHFMAECAGDSPVVLGDARLSLVDERDAGFDVLIVDAFSSDAIPVNLMTVEAFELYFQKLAKNGLVLIHISNRHLNLEPVLGNLARSRDWHGRLQAHRLDGTSDTANQSAGRYPSVWAAISRDDKVLNQFAPTPRWRLLEPDPAIALWTDDYSNILKVMDLGDGLTIQQ